MVLGATREAVRAWFPALASDLVYFENAGGSQVPFVVAEAVRYYMLTSYVQLGAGYPLSTHATETVAEAHRFMETFMGAGDAGKVVLGPSTTALVTILANAYADVIQPGDEVVIAETNHEANAGPWARLERRGAKVIFVRPTPDDTTLSLALLSAHLSDRTRIVALSHVSNLLGDIEDIRSLVALVRKLAPRARVIVDGVAYAPHRSIDVVALDVDFYVFSTYKVYGPHLGAMFGRFDAWADVEGPNHFFIPKDDIPYKFELGGVSHEACAGLLALRPYLAFMAGAERCDRAAIVKAFEVMTALEMPLVKRLIEYLSKKPGVKIIGSSETDTNRVGTISFVHHDVPSPVIAAAVQKAGIAIRHGHMYAIRLCKALGINEETGVVRVSFLHYNTTGEMDRLIAVLEKVLP